MILKYFLIWAIFWEKEIMLIDLAKMAEIHCLANSLLDSPMANSNGDPALISRDSGSVLHHRDCRHVIAYFATWRLFPSWFAAAETTYHCESDSLSCGNIPATISD